MSSRKLDLVVNRINEQNELDKKYFLKEEQINTRHVDILNRNRENLYIKRELLERRLQEGRIRNELMRLDKVKTTKEQRGNTVDTKMNTYTSQNFRLNPKHKDNIFNYIDNLNYVLDKHNDYRYRYHSSMLNSMDFRNFNKDRYYANIFDKFYNCNNDKRWMSNNVIFYLNRAVNDEVKEDKDFKEANKLNRYMSYLKNKQIEKNEYNNNLMNRHIDAKTKYNDFFLDKDDLLIRRVNDLREGKMDPYNEQERDYYHKIIINKDELDKRHKKAEKKRKDWENKIKILEEERRQKVQNILEKENNKFQFANKKEGNCLMNKKNAQIDTVRERDDIEKKAKEVELRSDRIYKNQTVYKKGMYDMPYTNYL